MQLTGYGLSQESFGSPCCPMVYPRVNWVLLPQNCHVYVPQKPYGALVDKFTRKSDPHSD